MASRTDWFPVALQARAAMSRPAKWGRHGEQGTTGRTMPTTALQGVMAWHMHTTFFTFLDSRNRGFFVQHMRNVGVTQNAHTPRPKVTSLSTSCRSSSSVSPFAGRPLMPGEGASRTPRTATPCRASRQTTRRNPGRTWSRCSRSPSMLRPRTRTGPAPAGSLWCH